MSDEERARDNIIAACQGCERCEYDDEEGLVAHCHACLVKIARAVHFDFYTALRAERERCMGAGLEVREEIAGVLAEVAQDGLSHPRALDAALDAIDEAYRAAIRALGEEG